MSSSSTPSPDLVAHSDRVAGWVGVVLAVITLFYAYLQIAHYAILEAGITLIIAAAMLCLAPFSNRLSFGAVHYVSAILFVAIGVVAYLRGGLVLAVVPFGMAAPIGATAVSRPRAAGFWLAMMVPMAACLHLLERSGLTPPKVGATTDAALSAAWTCVAVLIALVLIQERVRSNDVAAREEIQRQLVRANRLESVARLAGGVAHDFNNLLSIVTNHARALKLRGASATTLEDVDAIERAAEQGARLTHRLLAIGREDQGRSAEPLDIGELVSEVAELLHNALPETIELEQSSPEVPLVVMAEPRQLEQVVMNLAINSRDAMPHGGKLRLRTSQHTTHQPTQTRFATVPPGDYALLEISDDGTGMSADILEHVLEPFFTTKERDRGTGLGLAVVDGVVTSLGGYLDIDSTEGEGSVFRILLPTTQEPIQKRTVVTSTPAEPGALILLVEDDIAVRRATRRVLTLEGYGVIEAGDANEALAVSDAYDGVIDVLITDMVMPGPSGADLARELRQRRPEVGVVFFSGYAGDVLSEQDIRAERTVFLRKPPTQDDLNAAISATLADRHEVAPRSSA